MAGIALSPWPDSWRVGACILLTAAVVVVLLRQHPRWRSVAMACCVVAMGMMLGSRQQPTGEPDSQSSVSTAASDSQSSVSTAASHVRQQLLEHYHEWGISDQAYGVIAAMTLGDKTQIGRELKDTYSKVGSAHILALSGLHMMIIYSVITLFLGWRRIRMLSQVVVILALWAFALLVGMSPSVVRSAFMISIYGLLSLGYRERMSVNTLAFTAIVMLAIDPASLYDIGFQLSYMAVLCILLFNPLFGRLLPLHVLQRHRWLAFLWGLTTVSLSAQIGTAPLIAYYFGRFSTWFLLSNYLVVPLATVILWLTLCVVATCWWAALQQLLAALLSAVVVMMNQLLEAISQWPYCSIEGLRPSWVQVALVYLVIGCCYVLLSLKVARARQSV